MVPVRRPAQRQDVMPEKPAAMTGCVLRWHSQNVPPMAIAPVLRSVMAAPALKPPAAHVQPHLIVSVIGSAIIASVPTHAPQTTRVRMVKSVTQNLSV